MPQLMVGLMLLDGIYQTKLFLVNMSEVMCLGFFFLIYL